jgi:hypothetical protein
MDRIDKIRQESKRTIGIPGDFQGSSGNGQANYRDSGDMAKDELEARIGVEPTNKGFADLCLTTWLPRPEHA